MAKFWVHAITTKDVNTAKNTARFTTRDSEDIRVVSLFSFREDGLKKTLDKFKQNFFEFFNTVTEEDAEERLWIWIRLCNRPQVCISYECNLNKTADEIFNDVLSHCEQQKNSNNKNVWK